MSELSTLAPKPEVVSLYLQHTVHLGCTVAVSKFNGAMLFILLWAK